MSFLFCFVFRCFIVRRFISNLPFVVRNLFQQRKPCYNSAFALQKLEKRFRDSVLGRILQVRCVVVLSHGGLEALGVYVAFEQGEAGGFRVGCAPGRVGAVAVSVVIFLLPRFSRGAGLDYSSSSDVFYAFSPEKFHPCSDMGPTMNLGRRCVAFAFLTFTTA